jgi:hypothetical protein
MLVTGVAFAEKLKRQVGEGGRVSYSIITCCHTGKFGIDSTTLCPGGTVYLYNLGGAMQDRGTWEDRLSAELERENRPKRLSTVKEFLNSAFCIWFLTSVIAGAGVWSFQQLRDAQLKEEAAARKFEQLEFELEARTSQYITWFVKNYMKKVDKEVGFADGVTPEKLIASLRVFADLPRRNLSGYPNIIELYPEFKDRSLLTIFVELKSINERRRKPELLYPRPVPEVRVGDLSIQGVVPSPPSWNGDYEKLYKLPLEVRRRAIYVRAIEFLVSMELPDNISYESFKKLFTEVFLTGDISGSDFPYLDCFAC